jgi:hypothetical protein
MTKTMRIVKERRKWTINKEISLNNPQRGEEQTHGGAYPTGGNYITKGGEETSSPPQKTSTARPPLYSAVG